MSKGKNTPKAAPPAPAGAVEVPTNVVVPAETQVTNASVAENPVVIAGDASSAEAQVINGVSAPIAGVTHADVQAVTARPEDQGLLGSSVLASLLVIGGKDVQLGKIGRAHV